jgi:TolA-binding protein
VLLAQLDNTQADLGRRLLAEEKNLEVIPPSALGLMCSAALEQADFSRAEELFTFFSQNYGDSPFLNSAYQLRAEELFLKRQYPEALALASDALGLFGATPELGWAQIMKGRAQMELKQYDAAAGTFKAALDVPAWRGPLHAEAMFSMAEARFAQGDFENAGVFYQRVYLQYKSYDKGKWAADAYLRSADCLYKLNRAADARNTYRALLLDEYVRNLPQADVAKRALGPEETADLLAGQTNRIEAVSTEMKKP